MFCYISLKAALIREGDRLFIEAYSWISCICLKMLEPPVLLGMKLCLVTFIELKSIKRKNLLVTSVRRLD